MRDPLRLLSAFLLLAPVTGQTPVPEVRAKAFGMVRTAERAPWAGARIRLLSQPFPRNLTGRDAIEVTADDRGRFRADILVGQHYRAVAFAADGEHWRVCNRVDDVVPGLPVILDERSRQPRVRVQLHGLDAWPTPRPLALWCSSTVHGDHAIAVRLQENGVAEIPAMPTAARWLLLSAGNGLDQFRYPLGDDATGTVRIDVPPPVAIPIHIVDTDRNSIPGARVNLRSIAGQILAGTADADGKVTLVLPADPEAGAATWKHLRLWAGAEGHLTSRFPVAGNLPNRTGPWTIPLRKAEPMEGRILWRPGVPAAHAPVAITGVEQCYSVGSGDVFRDNPAFALDCHQSTGADGELLVPYRDDYPVSIALLLSLDQLSKLSRDLGLVPSRIALVWAKDALPRGFQARVDQLRPVRLVFRHRDRRPAPRAHVRVGPAPSPGAGFAFVADQKSSVTILLPETDGIMVAVWHEDAGDVVKIAVPPQRAGKAGVAEVLVELPEPVPVDGTVVRPDGSPVAGAEVEIQNRLVGFDEPWLDPPSGQDPKEPHIVGRGRYYPALALPMFLRQTTTDAEGRFRVMLPSLDFPLQVVVRDGAGGSERQYLSDRHRREDEPGAQVEIVLR